MNKWNTNVYNLIHKQTNKLQLVSYFLQKKHNSITWIIHKYTHFSHCISKYSNMIMTKQKYNFWKVCKQVDITVALI